MRNEDYDRELLAIVTFFCVMFATAASVLDASPLAATSVAQASTHAEQASVGAEPVRVVGTPFVPNTNPSRR